MKLGVRVLFAFATLIFIIWLLSFFLAFHIVGIKEVVIRFSKLGVATILIVLCSYLLVTSLWVMNWKLILKSLGLKASFFDLYASMLAGFFVDNITPTILVGGELTMAYVLKRRTKGRIRTARGMATVLFQMLCWFLGTVLFGTFALANSILFLKLPVDLLLLLLIPLSLFSLVFLTFVGLIYKRAISERVVFWFARKFEKPIRKLNPDLKISPVERAKGWISTFYSTLNSVPKGSLRLFFGALVFFVNYLIEAFALQRILVASGESVSYITVTVILILSNLIGLVSLIPGGLGTFELSMATFLSFAGISLQSTLLAIGMHRLIFFWFSTIAGGLVAIKTGISTIREVRI